MADNLSNPSEAEVVRMIYHHIQSLFPRTCPKCHRTFASYREYLENTKPLGSPISYDIEFGDWKPSQTTGNLSLANCSCGNTIALSSEGMPLEQIWQTLQWVKAEAERRNVETQTILDYLRKEVSGCGLTGMEM